MPIIQLPSSVGGAGDAAAAVTQQLNIGMQQQMQLFQMQEQRKMAQLELLQQQRQFAARMGMAQQQFDAELGLRREGFEADRTEAEARLAMQERQLANEDARDAFARQKAADDTEFRERAFAQETSLALQQQEQRARQVDAEVAYNETRRGAFIADRATAQQGVASEVARDLGGQFQVSGDGLLFMLQELAAADERQGTSYAREVDSLLSQLTGGEYDNIDDPFTLQARLAQDPRLPQLFTAAGQVALRARMEERAGQRAGELVTQIGSLARRFEALGDSRVQQEFEEFWATRLPDDQADTGTLLDYADGDAGADLRAWQQRLNLEEGRMAARTSIDALKSRLSAGWATEPIGDGTKGEQLSRIVGGLEEAESLQEVRAAQAQAAILLDPNAKLAADYVTRLVGQQANPRVAPAEFGGPQPLQGAERAVVMRAIQERFGVRTMDELRALVADPARGAEVEAYMDEVLARRQANARRSIAPNLSSLYEGIDSVRFTP